MVHPVALAGFIVAKKVVAYGVYKGIQRYGVGNLYRHLLRLNKQMTPVDQQRKVQDMVKAAFYVPTKVGAMLQDAEGRAFYTKALAELRSHSSTLYALLSSLPTTASVRSGVLEQLQSLSKRRPSTPG